MCIRGKAIIVANGKHQAFTKIIMYDATISSKADYYQDITKVIKNPATRFLFRLTHSGRLGFLFCSIPDELWFPYIDFTKVYNTDEVACFIFYLSEGFSSNVEYLTRLKHFFPHAKLILLATGSLNIYRRYLDSNKIDIHEVIRMYDHVEFWDKPDAEKLSVFHYRRTYSLSIPDQIDSCMKTVDLLFIGYAKNRLPEILKAYDFYSMRGVNCYFIITGVPKKEQVYRSGICYKKWMQYERALIYMKKCKVMLEIILNGMTTSTIRVEESIAFKSKLLTNNAEIIFDEYYCEKTMRVLDYSDDDVAFIMGEDAINHPMRDNISPDKSIRYYLKEVGSKEYVQ